ncbi:hypothetical protein CU097_015228 [Rhizopus azygosporus]|uniref:Anaphase spindle elongation protein 1 n=1 Tax=Rhizopus azygosporus TaxID=86630 RepID=A0A367KAZ0_RHIAZ|nr:hypothetical protein CU097_015228 [Rhizopus azygosporus]
MGEYAASTAVIDRNKSLRDNLQELQDELIKVKERYNESLIYVQELHKQLKALHTALGGFVNINLIATTEVDVSSLAVNSLEDELQHAEQEYARRKAIVDDTATEICNILVTLGIDSLNNKADKLVMQYHQETNPDKKIELCNNLVSEESIYYLTERIAQLKETQRQVEDRKEELTQKLKHLWDRLRIDPEECEVFLMANRGLTQEEIQNYEMELKRLLKIRQERIGDFIERAREELVSLWDQLYYTEDQRRQFHPAYSDETTDEILEAHESEISRLRLEVEDSKYILDRIEKYMKLKQEIEEFEASTRDPNRLFGKGQRDPGRLLREEKFRKRVERELPKISKELEGSLLEYEALKNRPFMVYGKPYLETIYDNKEAQQKAIAPRTPKRDTMPRKPFTSPRATTNKYAMFNTPQFNRTRSFQAVTETPKMDTSISILHRVRERNIRKRPQKPIRRGHFGSDDDDEEEEEEKAFTSFKSQTTHMNKQLPLKRKHMEPEFDSDDNLAVNLDIFDDGPDLSDMSDIDS